MNNDSLPRTLIILFLISFPLTLLAQPSDFVEQIELPSLVLAEPFSDDFTGDFFKDSAQLTNDSAQLTLAQVNQEPKPGIIQFSKKAGIRIKSTVALGIMSYEYRETFDQSPDDNLEWHDNIPYVRLGLKLDYNNFAVDIYGQQTMSGKGTKFETTPPPGVIIRDFNTNISRRDFAIHGNYAIPDLLREGDILLLSVGYKLGNSKINGTRRFTIDNRSEQGLFYDYYPEEIRFKNRGPSAGITYGFLITKTSRIVMNLAYTKFTNTEYTNTVFEVFGGLKADGRVGKGITGGLAWTGAITNNVSYSLSFDYIEYSMRGISERTGTGFSLDEEVISFKASISYASDNLF